VCNDPSVSPSDLRDARRRRWESANLRAGPVDGRTAVGDTRPVRTSSRLHARFAAQNPRCEHGSAYRPATAPQRATGQDDESPACSSPARARRRPANCRCLPGKTHVRARLAAPRIMVARLATQRRIGLGALTRCRAAAITRHSSRRSQPTRRHKDRESGSMARSRRPRRHGFSARSSPHKAHPISAVRPPADPRRRVHVLTILSGRVALSFFNITMVARATTYAAKRRRYGEGRTVPELRPRLFFAYRIVEKAQPLIERQPRLTD